MNRSARKRWQFGVDEELVEVGLPVGHFDIATTLRTKLSAVEEHHDNAIERVDLFRIEVFARL